MRVEHVQGERDRGERSRELASSARGLWSIHLWVLQAGGELEERPRMERTLVMSTGASLEVLHGDGAPRARLRRMEPYRCPDGALARAEVGGGAAELVEILTHPAVRADAEPLRLGLRRAREPLPEGDAWLLALRGGGRARVTGEEDPFELAPGDTLVLEGLRGHEELDLAGSAPQAEFLLVRLAHAGRDDRRTIG